MSFYCFSANWFWIFITKCDAVTTEITLKTRPVNYCFCSHPHFCPILSTPMVRLVLILSIIQHFLDRRDHRCFICYPISIKDLFKRQYVKCVRELFGLIITHSVYSSLDYDMVNSFHEQCNAGQYVFPLISCLGYTLEKIFFFVYFCLRLSMSKILDAIQKLLLLCGQLHQELGPSPIGVQKVGRRTGEDQQLR